MKVELEKLRLAKSSLTDEVFIGTINKKGDKWLNKANVTRDFITAAIARWEGQKETISSGKEKWEISIKKVS